MRQLAHKLVGIFFWILLVGLWVVLIREGKAGRHNIAYSVQYVAIVGGAVLAVTLWWIRHNMNIYKRKGPRKGRAESPPRIDEDRLGRPVAWKVRGGHDQARRAGHLVVEVVDGTKVYRRPE